MKRTTVRGPTNSVRVEQGVITGRHGFWIGWSAAGRDEIFFASELRRSLGSDSSKRDRATSSSERYQVRR